MFQSLDNKNIIDNKLAIVIPAYKKEFLDACLQSLTNQSCSRFNVYIGIDASPHDLEIIIDKYSEKLNVSVKRFIDNFSPEYEKAFLRLNENFENFIKTDEKYLSKCYQFDNLNS